MKQDTERKNLLITAGGSGTNFVYAKFGKRNLVGHYGDHEEKFWPSPHQRFPVLHHPTRVLYIVSHPLNMLMSFDRRGFLKNLAHVTNVQGDVNEARLMLPCKLKEYDKNIFDFKGHFLNWQTYCKENGHSFIYVKYHAIGRKLMDISDYLQLKPNKEPYFIERNSNYDTLLDYIRERLEVVHKDDIDFFNTLKEYGS